jgi:putative membrane protein
MPTGISAAMENAEAATQVAALRAIVSLARRPRGGARSARLPPKGVPSVFFLFIVALTIAHFLPRPRDSGELVPTGGVFPLSEAVVRDPGQARFRPTIVRTGLASVANPTLAASLAAIFLLAVGGLLAAATIPLGPITSHMCAHIWLMNAIAPAFVLVMARNGIDLPAASGVGLTAATVGQMTLLWAAHAPPLLQAASASPVLHYFMQAALCASALWFWSAVLAQRGAARWRALFALLMSGKLFCLLAVLLVFAPRFFYGGHEVGHAHGGVVDQLADQHLAGLLMLVVCPLSYVGAAVVIAAQWLREVAAREEAPATIPSRSMSVR